MSRQRPLRGACSCGRNHYTVVVPTESIEQAQVYFDDSSESRMKLTHMLAECELTVRYR